MALIEFRDRIYLIKLQSILDKASYQTYHRQ